MNQPAATPAAPPAQAGTNDVDPNLVIAVALSVKQINQLLFYLGKQPLGECLDLFNSLKGQGDMALAAMKLGGGTPPATADTNQPAGAPPANDAPEDPPPARPPSSRRRNRSH